MFQADINWQSYIEESFKLYYPEIEYHFLNETSPSDSLYGEEKNKNYTIYTFPAFVRVNPDEKLLTKFGYDTAQDIFIAVPVSILSSVGINIKVGDKIKFNGRTYKITTFKEKHENNWKNYLITAVGKLDGG